MKFGEWLKANGFDEGSLSDTQKSKLKASFDAEMAEAEKEKGSAHGEGFLAALEAEKKERARVDSINDLASAAMRTYPTQLETIERLVKAAHHDKACTPKDFELELLRNRPSGPTPFMSGGSDGAVSDKVVSAAICKSLGLQNVEKHYDERTLDATDRHFRHGISLKQLLFRAAATNGQHYDSAANLRGLLKAAFGDSQIKATGFSTFSLPGIMADVMNKVLLDYFNSVESTWRTISAIRPVTDFRQINSYSLTGDLQYEELGPTGEIKHGTLGEETYTNQAKTYAKMLAITRTDIINDDLGAMQKIPQRLGRGGALKINDVFWTAFMANSSFWTTANGHLDEGADTALGIDSLGLAEAIFLNGTDPDGNPLGIAPQYLLVPNAKLALASQLMSSTEIRNTTASTVYPVSNPHAGKFEVVRSSYLSNTNYTGNSALAWYLLANPMDMPVIETVFLNGNQSPTVESADADFDQLGIQVRAYHDFGVSKQEYRGGVKMKGEV